MFTSSNTGVTPFSRLPSYSYNHSPPPQPPPPPPPHFSVEEASHDGFSYPQFLYQDPFFSNTQMAVVTENKDHNRHRKICTSQGVRDRRVRLSVDIARKFFDLQDMLGFDKASKTLEWLLMKSRKSIRKLSDPNHHIGGSTTNYSLRRTSTSVVPENGDLEEILNLPKNMSSLLGVSNTPSQSKMKKTMVNLGAQNSIRSTARAREGIMPCYLKVDANQIEDFGGQIPSQEPILSNTCFPNFPQNWDISNAIAGSGVYGEPAMGTHNNHEYYQY